MKTKLFTLLLAVAASLGTMFASNTSVGGIWYDFNNQDFTATVTCKGNISNPETDWYRGEVVIPASVTYNNKTYTVISIGARAFYACPDLTSIEIPNSITSIGDEAFCVCTGLTSIEIPNSVTSIGESAFFHCGNLTSASIGNSVTSIRKSAFDGCSALISVTIGNSVTSIGDYAFWGCESLTSIEIPNSVTSIYWGGFKNCTSLTSVTIPNSVTIIGPEAFSGCTKLSVEIPNSVTWIGDHAFDNVLNVVYNGTATGSPWGARCINGGYVEGDLVYSDASKTQLLACSITAQNVEIPNSVTELGDYAFSGCSISEIHYSGTIQEWCIKTWDPGVISSSYTLYIGNEKITDLVLPDDITSIGDNAFRGYTALTSIEIPNSVTNIGGSAFSGCTSLTSVTIGNSVTSIGGSAFAGCSALTSIEIPNSVTNIGESAFYGCTGLTSIEIPNSVTSIENYAFRYCSSLTSVTIGKSITSIGDYAFGECESLTTVVWNARNCNGYNFGSQVTSFTFGDEVEVIPESICFRMYKLTSMSIPTSVTSIGHDAFRYCSSLTSVTIGKSITSIGDNAFHGCGISEIHFNGTIQKWCEKTWSTSAISSNYTLYIGNEKIADLVLPEDITSIGDGAFYGCTGLTSVSIPNSVTSIGDGAFYGCTGLTSIEIPNRVTNIGDDAFRYCSSLTTIEIPNSVTSIGEFAFFHCGNLTSASIGNSVTSIRKSAFDGCSALISVTIGNSVTSIGDYAFWGCESLTSIEIPNSVTSIGDKAFQNCTGLASVIIGNGVISIEQEAFSGCTGLTSIIWNAKKYNDFATTTATPLSNIKLQITSFVFGPDVEHIPAYICNGMTNLKTLSIVGTKVKSIGAYAFQNVNSRGFRTLTIPHVQTIGKRAFGGCSYLETIDFGANLESIGAAAFKGCTRVATMTCLADVTPEVGEDGLTSISDQAELYVLKNCVQKYKVDANWNRFIIKEKAAENTDVTDVAVIPEENSVNIVWPSIADAYTYEIVIKDKNDNVICTMIFNSNGQLTSIAFAPSRNGAPQHTQTAGFAFTVSGLEMGTEYDLTVTAKNATGQTLDKKNVTFRTNWPTAVEDLYVNSDKPVKVLMDGQIYILRGEHVYDTEGKMVK